MVIDQYREGKLQVGYRKILLFDQFLLLQYQQEIGKGIHLYFQMDNDVVQKTSSRYQARHLSLQEFDTRYVNILGRCMKPHQYRGYAIRYSLATMLLLIVEDP